MSRIIGLTGGIGSGKTEVARLFALLGASIYTADEVSKRLLDSNEALRVEIANAFGKDLYQHSKLNRKAFAAIIFGNDKSLALANAIIHPFVFADFKKWSERNQEQSYLVMETAILFESHANERMDKSITVYSPLEIRISRVIKRDGCSREDVLRRMKFQITEEEKLKMTDFVIYNDEEHMLIPQVLALHKQFI